MIREKFEALAKRTWLVQATYFIVSGVWPVVEIRSFQAVTGPKVDRWLVKTVGLLVAVIGGALALAGLRRRITPEMAMVAMGSSASLAVIDVTYVARRRISPVYLLDAAGEVVLMAGWVVTWRRGGVRAR